MKNYNYIIMVITFIFNSCSNIEYNNSKSDLEKMNLKGDICFIIEQKIDINNDQEIPVYEKTIKFNRYSKISYIKENNKEKYIFLIRQWSVARCRIGIIYRKERHKF